jgi:hypothetical protein
VGLAGRMRLKDSGQHVMAGGLRWWLRHADFAASGAKETKINTRGPQEI